MASRACEFHDMRVPHSTSPGGDPGRRAAGPPRPGVARADPHLRFATVSQMLDLTCSSASNGLREAAGGRLEKVVDCYGPNGSDAGAAGATVETEARVLHADPDDMYSGAESVPNSVTLPGGHAPRSCGSSPRAEGSWRIAVSDDGVGSAHPSRPCPHLQPGRQGVWATATASAWRRWPASSLRRGRGGAERRGWGTRSGFEVPYEPRWRSAIGMALPWQATAGSDRHFRIATAIRPIRSWRPRGSTVSLPASGRAPDAAPAHGVVAAGLDPSAPGPGQCACRSRHELAAAECRARRAAGGHRRACT